LEENLRLCLEKSFLENTACEHAARMSAMDNATRNAKDMIVKLNLKYNQQRQSYITNQLIEIISASSAITT
jgi:F-type H+-transporting ATPase subunit gamma